MKVNYTIPMPVCFLLLAKTYTYTLTRMQICTHPYISHTSYIHTYKIHTYVTYIGLHYTRIQIHTYIHIQFSRVDSYIHILYNVVYISRCRMWLKSNSSIVDTNDEICIGHLRAFSQWTMMMMLWPEKHCLHMDVIHIIFIWFTRV